MPRAVSTSADVVNFLLSGKAPERTAFTFLNARLSYGDLDLQSAAIGRGLVKSGLVRGDRVVLAADNSVFWIVSYLGILRAGLVCVPIPTSLQPEELEHLFESTGAQCVFGQASFISAKATVLGGKDIVTDKEIPPIAKVQSQSLIESFSAEDSGDHALPDDIALDDLAALVFTSGSTGLPKGVMISHGNIIANTAAIVEYLELTENDRIMAVLPFHYCYGASLVHTHLRAGGEVVVDSRFMYPETILQRMLAAECTGFAGVPSHFQILLRNSTLKKKEFPRLRYVQQAGGALAPSFIKELRLALPQTKVFVQYGQTEATARLSYLPPEYLDTKLGSIGKGIPGVELRVVNPENQEVQPGETGEIVARGPNVARGYWRDESETASIFQGGALRTGDLARIDEDGFIFVMDRTKDFIKCRGEKVSCREVEEQLLAYEDLIEVAVIGVPDDILGEAVKAFVVPRGKEQVELEKGLLQFCKGRLPSHYHPKEIVVLKALPKNGSGKVLRALLRNS